MRGFDVESVIAKLIHRPNSCCIEVAKVFADGKASLIGALIKSIHKSS